MALFKWFPPALFKRFPRFHPLPSKPQEIVPPEARSKYPDFASDFETLQDELLPAFRELDNQAILCQNRYRAMYLVLVLGGTLVTIVTILQIAFSQATWIDYIGGSFAAVLAVMTSFWQPAAQQKRYFDARLGAERLRSEYFLFLRHTAPYENAQDRRQKLAQRIIDIRRKAEGSGIA
jgi:hypothetical protein